MTPKAIRQDASMTTVANGNHHNEVGGTEPSTKAKITSDLTPSNPWCCIASILDDHNENIQVEKISGNDSFRKLAEHTQDLTIFSEFAEWIEFEEDRMKDEGGAGAYDVFRCDLLLTNNDERRWKLWGQEYHLRRLRNSYLTLNSERRENILEVRNEDLDVAYRQTKSIISALLKEAEVSSQLMIQNHEAMEDNQDRNRNSGYIQLVKMSILWSPEKHIINSGRSQNRIIVRGHACSSCRPIPQRRTPDPIVATIAVSLHDQAVLNDDGLPNRSRCPQTKVASWCRLRRPLENPDTYKPKGVGEVLLVRPIKCKANNANQQEMELLEGITSNVFVVYTDGTVRTANDGVLFGYARHLVLKCINRCGLTYDASPILLSDAKKGFWKEAFITSSSRLIYPIAQILVPHDAADDQEGVPSPGDGHYNLRFTELWNDPCFVDEKNEDKYGNRGKVAVKMPKWKMIRNAMFDDSLDEGEETRN